MKSVFQIRPMLLSVICVSALAGCMSDAMTGDFAAPAPHGSANYPIVAHNHGAEVKACGKWDEDLTATKENRAWSNFGCAVQHNIAAELDDPSSLNNPKKPPIKDSTDAVLAAYRQSQAVNTTILPGNYDLTK